MSKTEWDYLLGTNSERNGKYKNNVTVNGVACCLVIAPDIYSGTIASSYNADEWALAESDGHVCLPVAGFRADSEIFDSGSTGNYWSASPFEYFEGFSYILEFDNSHVDLLTFTSCNGGCSIRLVSSVSK